MKSNSMSRQAIAVFSKNVRNDSKRRLRGFYLPLALAVASAAVSARAANLVWDPTQNPASPAGGTGTWDLSTLNWSTGSVDQAWTDVSTTGTDTATFGGTGGVVTLSTTLSALGLQFNATGYTISGSNSLTLGSGGINASSLSSGTVTISKTIVLAADQTWSVGAGATLAETIAAIGGTGNLTIAGAGNVSLTNGATISGTLNVTGNLLTAQDLHVGGLTGNGIIQDSSASDKWFFVTNTANQTFSGQILGGASKLGLNKSGNGTLTLTGANQIDDAVTVNAGTVIFSGNHNNTTQVDVVGTTAATNAVLVLPAGVTFNANDNTGQPYSSSINISTNATSAGSIQNNGATVVVNRQMAVGGTGYGAYTQTAGNTTIGGFLALGGNAQGGVFNLTGGTYTLATGDTGAITVGYASNTAINGGVMNVGGTGTLVDNANSGGGLWIGEVNTGILNVSGSANITINAAGSGGGVVLGKNNTANSHGVVNLNGGTLTTPSVTQGGTTGTSIFSFNGGTLKANANNTSFFTGVTSAYVYGNGGTIDDGGNSITIGESLTAPTGNGVSATGLTVSGSGFIDTPLVSVTGGGGAGATAVATIDSNGNLTGITITNPGTGYTSAPTFALVGGGRGNTGAIGGAATLVANTSGGITKAGSGIVTLTGTNTYGGTTNITGGTLAVGSGGSISGPISVTSGTLTGGGTVGNVTVNSSASNTIANTSGGVLTIGNLTFNGNAAMNLTVSSTTSVVNTTKLTTSGGGGVSTGKITVNVGNTGSWTSGVYDLVGYSSFGGVGFSDFIKGTIAGLGVRQSATLTNPAGFIALTVAGDSPKWTGALSSEWSTATLSNPKNWQLITGGTATDYIQGDTVLFDDSASNKNVNISVADVLPTSVTFANTGGTYTVSGAFGIAGTSNVTISGGGTVALSAPSTYSGGTNLTNGVLAINASSAIGSGALNISGGSIDNTSGSSVTLTTNNTLNLTTDLTFGGTKDLNLGTGALALTAARNFNVNGTANLTIGGVISGNFGITVQGSGSGALVLTGNNTNVGTTIIHSATLQVAGGTFGTLTTAASSDIQVSPGASDSGTLMVTGGVVNANRVIIGGDSANTAGGNAKVIQSGGTINSQQWFTVGSGNPAGNSFPAGEYDLSGGTMNLISQQMEVANFFGTSGIVNMTGGNINLENNTSIALGANNNAGDGNFTQSAGNVTFYSNTTAIGGTGILYLGKAASLSGTYTYNLNGGTLTVPQVQQTAANGGTGVFNLNGGTLKAAKANVAWVSGLSTMAIGASGGTIDDGGFAVTIPQAISDNGGGPLTKQGVGTLALTGTNTYLGQTNVIAGSLVLSGTGDINGSSGINVNGGKFVQISSTAVSPTVTINNGTVTGSNATINSVVVSSSATAVIANGNNDTGVLTIGSLTFNGNAVANITLAGPSATSSPGIVTNSLTTSGGSGSSTGNITLNAFNSAWSVGVYDLIGYSSIGGVGFNDFKLGTVGGLSPRQGASLTNVSGEIALTVSGGNIPVWTGALNGNWTTATLSAPKNWKLQTGGATTDFLTGDTVLFDDTATGTTSVSISDASVSPSSTTFNNSSKNYTISSAGGFGIAAGILVKNGTGAVTINTANTYAGGTSLNAGTLNVNNAAALGTGPIVINGGAFGNTSGAAVTQTGNGAVTISGDFAFNGTNDLGLSTGAVTLNGSGTSRSINVTSNVLAIGPIQSAAAYGLTKIGSGTLTIAAAANDNAAAHISTLGGSLDVEAGTFQTGGNDFNAGGLLGNGTIENGSNVTRWLFVNSTANQTFGGILQDGTSGGRLGFNKNGANTTLTLTGNNAYSDVTNVNAGTLVFSGNTNNTTAVDNVATVAATNAVLVLSSGSTFSANDNTGQQYNSSMNISTNATSAGSVKNNGANFSVARQLAIGGPSYGAFSQTAGNTTVGGFVAVGASASGGVINLNGGSFSMPGNSITLGYGASSPGILNVSGNASMIMGNIANGFGNGIWVGEVGTGVLNLSGTANITIPNDSLVIANGTTNGGNRAVSGIANLNGGTLTTNSVSAVTGTGASTALLNFNGGTLKANIDSTNFISNSTTGGGSFNVFVYGGGATIDDGGHNITIAQPLQAPTGNGVSATGLTFSGGGYIDTPIVTITGDGTGATAVANIDSNGNLTGITITNPGTGYSTSPTFSLVGGGVSGSGSISGSAALVPNVGGKLTKVGAGNVTLSAANTYSGGTSVSNGTLIAANVQALGTGAIAIHSGAKLQLQNGLAMAVVTPAVTFDGSTGAWSGQLDMTNDKMVVEATVSKATALANLQNQAHSVITSSTMAASYGIAVIDNDNGSGGTRFATFGGQQVDSNSILISPELLGDANADGVVNQADLNTVLSHFGSATAAWTSGNFDGAATIDLTDLSAVLNNFGLSNPNASGVQVVSGGVITATAAPEPASLAVLALGAGAMLCRRRKSTVVA